MYAFLALAAAAVPRGAAAFAPLAPTLLRRRALAHARRFGSVTGTVYSSGSAGGPTVTLYTKEGCTLCDKAVDVLRELNASAAAPHTLESVDITDAGREAELARYMYDIPVLHVEGQYWAKHRITAEDAAAALAEAAGGAFAARPGEPDAARLTRQRGANRPSGPSS